MPSAIFTIARSGLTATRRSLELTAQNVANAANPDDCVEKHPLAMVVKY